MTCSKFKFQLPKQKHDYLLFQDIKVKQNEFCTMYLKSMQL